METTSGKRGWQRVLPFPRTASHRSYTHLVSELVESFLTRMLTSSSFGAETVVGGAPAPSRAGDMIDRIRWLDRTYVILQGSERKKAKKSSAFAGGSDRTLDEKHEQDEKKDLGDDEGGSIMATARISGGTDSRSLGGSGREAGTTAEDFHFHTRTKVLALKLFRRILNGEAGRDLGREANEDIDPSRRRSQSKSSPTVGGGTTGSRSLTAPGGPAPFDFDLPSCLYTTNTGMPRAEEIRQYAESHWLDSVDSLVNLACFTINDSEYFADLLEQAVLTLLAILRLFEYTREQVTAPEGGTFSSTFAGFAGAAGAEADSDEEQQIPVGEKILVRFEAQLSTCVRKCFRSEAANADLHFLGVLVLFETVRTDVSSTPERVLNTIAQPLLSADGGGTILSKAGGGVTAAAGARTGMGGTQLAAQTPDNCQFTQGMRKSHWTHLHETPRSASVLMFISIGTRNFSRKMIRVPQFSFFKTISVGREGAVDKE